MSISRSKKTYARTFKSAKVAILNRPSTRLSTMLLRKSASVATKLGALSNANMKCPLPTCGYEWKSRIKNPKCCPLCKAYIDNGSKILQAQPPSSQGKRYNP